MRVDLAPPLVRTRTLQASRLPSAKARTRAQGLRPQSERAQRLRLGSPQLSARARRRQVHSHLPLGKIRAQKQPLVLPLAIAPRRAALTSPLFVLMIRRPPR